MMVYLINNLITPARFFKMGRRASLGENEPTLVQG
jgi:hypothetical protein